MFDNIYRIEDLRYRNNYHNYNTRPMGGVKSDFAYWDEILRLNRIISNIGYNNTSLGSISQYGKHLRKTRNIFCQINYVISKYDIDLDRDVDKAIEQCKEICHRDILENHKIDFIYYNEIIQLRILKEIYNSYFFSIYYNIDAFIGVGEIIIEPYKIGIVMIHQDGIKNLLFNFDKLSDCNENSLYRIYINKLSGIGQSEGIKNIDMSVYNRDYKIKQLLHGF